MITIKKRLGITGTLNVNSSQDAADDPARPGFAKDDTVHSLMTHANDFPADPLDFITPQQLHVSIPGRWGYRVNVQKDKGRYNNDGVTFNWRSELRSFYDPAFKQTKMYWSLDVYIPVSYVADSSYDVLYQNYGGNSDTGRFYLRTTNGRFYIQNTQSDVRRIDVGPHSVGMHRFEFYMHWSKLTSEGRFKVWKNGELAQAHNPNTGVPWRITKSGDGTYSWPSTLGEFPIETPGGVSLCDFYGRTLGDTQTLATQRMQCGIYKPAWADSSPTTLREIYTSNINFIIPQTGWAEADILTALRTGTDYTPVAPVESDTFYVSPTGLDTNDGTSTGSAWRSQEKVSASSFSPGKTIKFERGGKWKGTLTIPTSGTAANPITYDAYGTGDLPTFDGWNYISGWVSEGGGIYSKTDSAFQSDMRMVVLNDVIKPKGRFPKTGWLPTTSATTNTSITSTSLTGTPNFNGGEVVILKVTWRIDKGTITSHSGGTIGYTGTSQHSANVGYGFFIQNHVNCLTELGEWYYDGVAKKIFMYFGANSPASYVVKVSDTVNLITCNAKNYVNIQNISLQGAHNSGVNFVNCNNNSVKFCNIEKSGFNGIFLDNVGDVDNIKIEDNIFRDTFNSAIKGENSRFVDVRRNNIQRNHLIAGTSGNGDNQGSAIALGTFTYRNGNYNVENNYIKEVGYNGIYLSGSNILVQKNEILGVCKTKEDGAAIYFFGAKETLTDTYNTNRIVRRNICYNSGPNSNPTPNGTREVFGIYFDDRSRNIICDYNTVHGNYAGIYVHNSRDISLQYNNSYKNTLMQLFLGDDNNIPDVDGNIQGMDVRYNNLYALTTSEILRVNNETASIADLGIINNNFYIKPDGGILIRKQTNFGSDETFSTVPAWTTAHGYDSATNATPTASLISDIYLNKTGGVLNVNIGTGRKSLNGVSLDSIQSIGSFESLIVLEGQPDGGVAPGPGPNPFPDPGSGLSFKIKLKINIVNI